MGLLKIHYGGNYAHAQVSSVYNFFCSSNSTKFIRTFIRQFSKGNNLGLLKINNGGNYAHAQYSNAYNFCLSSKKNSFVFVYS